MADIKIKNNEEMSEEKLKEEVMAEISRLNEAEEQQAELTLLYPPIEFSEEEFAEMYLLDEWKRGIKLGAELVALYSTMVNAGMDAIVSNSIVMNHHAMYVNIETQKIINEGVRIQGAAIKKTQL